LFQLGPSEEAAAKVLEDDARLDIKNQVVRTQVLQVAFQLRQKHRAFDTACLLEILCDDLL